MLPVNLPQADRDNLALTALLFCDAPAQVHIHQLQTPLKSLPRRSENTCFTSRSRSSTKSRKVLERNTRISRDSGAAGRCSAMGVMQQLHSFCRGSEGWAEPRTIARTRPHSTCEAQCSDQISLLMLFTCKPERWAQISRRSPSRRHDWGVAASSQAMLG